MTPHAENRLLRHLELTRAAGRMALCGYFLAAYPTPERFYEAVRSASALDVIEFGIPADEPALDGPVIANAHEIVIRERGVKAETALVLIGGLRAIPQPRFVMVYTAVGRQLEGFFRLCIQNDVHGVLVPDIAPDEAKYIASIARPLGLAVISLADARADDATLREAVMLGDMLYLKASAGKTGVAVTQEELHNVLGEALARVRAIRPELPIAVGIGLQHPAQIAALAALNVDMAIVGTKIIENVNSAGFAQYLAELQSATRYPQG